MEVQVYISLVMGHGGRKAELNQGRAKRCRSGGARGGGRVHYLGSAGLNDHAVVSNCVLIRNCVLIWGSRLAVLRSTVTLHRSRAIRGRLQARVPRVGARREPGVITHLFVVCGTKGLA